MQVGGTRILNAAGEYHCVATPWTQKILEGSGSLPSGLPRLVIQGPGNNIGIVENDRTEIYTHQYPTRHFLTSSSPSWSHHLSTTHVPSLCIVSLKRPRIGRIVIYCTTVFCIFSTYASTSSNPASYIAAYNGGYYKLLSRRLWSSLTVIRLATLFWPPPPSPPGPGPLRFHNPHLWPQNK